MKTLKKFTDGLAICLAVLALIFVLTNYLGFDFKAYDEKYSEDALLEKEEEDAKLPEEQREEVLSKIEYFFRQSPESKDYFLLAVLLLISGGLGFLLRRFSGISLVLSTLPICYALTLFDAEKLIKYPLTVITFSLSHCVGAIVFAAAECRRRPTLGCPVGGIACGVLAAVGGVYSLYLQNIVSATSGYVHFLDEAGVTVPRDMLPIKNVVESLYFRVTRGDVEAANNMISNFRDDLVDNMGARLVYGTVNTLETTDYKRLVLVLFAAAVLSLAFVILRKRTLAAIVAAVPAVYAFMLLLLGKISTLTLPIVLLTLVMAIAVGAYREAEGEPPVSELEREEYEAFIAEEEKDSPAAEPDGDEIFYN
ncbi:MAG: hypothetical protein IKJ80_00325 [Clostridia bacterium]|nr:hypothetical protein [Clostridia bacterium]